MLKKSASDDILGRVLSAHKKLVAEKFAEEDVERKVKAEAKKEKHLMREKGHVKLENFLDSHEKSLIEVATKGVVKLFNAVNKAQHAQKGLNPSREKDEKAIKKRRREVFSSELGKAPSQTAVSKDTTVADDVRMSADSNSSMMNKFSEGIFKQCWSNFLMYRDPPVVN